MTTRAAPADPLLRRITDTIVEHYRPRRIVLLGSRARGDAGPESDYDLMVEMDSQLPMPERAMAIDRLFGLRDWSMNVFVFTPAEVAGMRDRVGTLIHSIERDGVAIYEQPALAAPADAIQAAHAFGVDIGQLRESLKRTPDERLRELEANAPFLAALQAGAKSKKGSGG